MDELSAGGAGVGEDGAEDGDEEGGDDGAELGDFVRYIEDELRLERLRRMRTARLRRRLEACSGEERFASRLRACMAASVRSAALTCACNVYAITGGHGGLGLRSAASLCMTS